MIRVTFATTAAVIMLGSAVAAAQDTRTVREPVVPPTCTTLKALLIAPHGIVPADEQWLDTQRIQDAIDHCGGLHAVELAADGERSAFLSGPLYLRKGVTLLVDKGVTLYGSRNPVDYEVSKGSCGLVNDSEKRGCRALINAKRAHSAGIMGEGTIDGRGGSELLVDGKELGKTWWDLAEDARDAGHQQVPRLIDTDHSDDFTLYQITLRNAANVHVGFHNGNGLTVWGVKIDTPKDARNTDGVDPAESRNVTIIHSYIRSGDDNVAIKAGSGASKNISVLYDHFYWGHGMSIGSETNGGVSAVLVQDLSIDGADNGIRIKSNPDKGGLVKNVEYQDVCIRRSKHPIVFQTAYSRSTGFRSKEPVYQDIVMKNVRIAGGGRLDLLGLDAKHRIGLHLDGVLLEDPRAKYKLTAAHTDLTLGPGPVNLHFTSEDGTLSGIPAPTAGLPACDDKFVPYPAR